MHGLGTDVYDMQLAGLCTTTALVYEDMFSGAG